MGENFLALKINMTQYRTVGKLICIVFYCILFFICSVHYVAYVMYCGVYCVFSINICINNNKI